MLRRLEVGDTLWWERDRFGEKEMWFDEVERVSVGRAWTKRGYRLMRESLSGSFPVIGEMTRVLRYVDDLEYDSYAERIRRAERVRGCRERVEGRRFSDDECVRICEMLGI